MPSELFHRPDDAPPLDLGEPYDSIFSTLGDLWEQAQIEADKQITESPAHIILSALATQIEGLGALTVQLAEAEQSTRAPGNPS